MKLSLAQKDGIQIIEVQGDVDAHNLQILKAGITKLFREGKNKIALKLASGTESLPGEVIRELAILDILAKELAGTILIICSSEKVRESLKNFSKPPVIPIFIDDESALSYFRATKAEEPSAAELPPSKELLDAKEKEIAALKQQLSLLNPAEVQALRRENANLASQLKVLETQLQLEIYTRRTPPGLEAYEQKVLLLEESLAKVTAEQQKEKK